MSKIHKARILTMLAIAAAAGLLLPAIFGEPRNIVGQSGGDSWRNFVYDFQTLIAGVLAIGAAYFTIKSGQKIDERQQVRHEEILELQTRPDKLRVARAHVLFRSVEQNRTALKNCSIPEVNEPLDPSKDFVMEVAMINMSCRMLLAALDNSSFEQIRDLFDGDLQVKFERLRYHVENFSQKVVLLGLPNGQEFDFEFLPGTKYRVAMTSEYRGTIRNEMVARLSDTKARLEAFETGFDWLARHYKVIR